MATWDISEIDAVGIETRRHLYDYLTGPVLEFVARASPERVLTVGRFWGGRRAGHRLLIPRGQVGHSHAHPEVSVLIEGRCALGRGPDFYELAPGDWVLHPPRMEHVEAALPGLQPFRQMWFLFLEQQADLTVSRYEARSGWQLEHWFQGQPGRFKANARQVMEQLTADIEADRVSSLRATLLEIVYHFVGELETAPLRRHQSIDDAMVRDVLVWMDRERPGKYGLQLAARTVGCSTATLTRRFVRAMGCSFAAYVRKRRLEHAQHLLDTTSLSVAAISDRCGFTDDSHLSRVFRHAVGCTPKQFRNRLRPGRRRDASGSH